MLIYHHVTKVYPSRRVIALRDINLTINEGEFVYILGHTGSGKSTLIELAYRAQLPTFGYVSFKGKNLNKLSLNDISNLRRQIGVVFQDFRLIPYRTVTENISLPLEVLGWLDYDIKTRLEELFKLINLRNKGDLFPKELSGGEQQRVALARAIAFEPLILLADEPTANLDKEATNSIMSILEMLNKKGVTIVLATHNEQLVKKIPGRIVRLKEGKLISDE